MGLVTNYLRELRQQARVARGKVIAGVSPVQLRSQAPGAGRREPRRPAV